MNNVINIDFTKEILPAYLKAYKKQINFIVGGRGSWKTGYGKRLTLRELLNGNSVLIVRNTQASHKDSTLSELVEMLTEYNLPFKYVTSPTPRITLGKAVVLFAGMDKPEKIKSMKPLNSSPIKLIWFEEAVEMLDKLNYDDAWIEINKIRFTFGRGKQDQGVKTIFTYNPDKPGHWLEQKEKEIGFNDNEQLIRTTYKDNKYLGDEYIAELKTFKDTWPEYYEQIAHGKWMNLQDSVYLKIPTYQSNEELPSYFDKLNIGIDIGYNDDTAFSLVGIKDGSYYFLEEMTFNKKDFVEIESNLYEFITNQVNKYQSVQQTRIIIETATGGLMLIKTLKTKLTNHKVLRANKKYKNAEGILAINKLISFNKLFMRKDSTTHKQFTSLRYDKNNKPTDGNDHLHDASKYSVSYEIYK